MTAYAVFNYLEGVFGVSVGLFLLVGYRFFRTEKIRTIQIAIPTFVLFGLSDYLETPP